MANITSPADQRIAHLRALNRCAILPGLLSNQGRLTGAIDRPAAGDPDGDRPDGNARTAPGSPALMRCFCWLQHQQGYTHRHNSLTIQVTVVPAAARKCSRDEGAAISTAMASLATTGQRLET